MASRLLSDITSVHTLIVKLPTAGPKSGEFLDRSSSMLGHMEIVMSRLFSSVEDEGGLSIVADLEKQIDSIITRRDGLMNDIQAALQTELASTRSTG